MNKLASIFLLHNLGLPTIDPCIITGNTEKQIRKQVDAFYQDRELGWVLRCGGFPDEKAYMERGLP
ncbi:MAG: hypothetical protein KKE23_03280 [Nanoarchaeota archaeon]|nr:hypothetical protein [Nanoarchaeota archaeon]